MLKSLQAKEIHLRMHVNILNESRKRQSGDRMEGKVLSAAQRG